KHFVRHGVSRPFLALSLPIAALALPLESRDGAGNAISAAFYTGWHSTDVPLSSVSWDKYNTLIYAFAIRPSVTTPDVHTLSLNGSNPTLLPDFVKQAHDHGVSAHIGVGGWTGGIYFSSNLNSANNRTAFVKTVVDFLGKYNLDGVNFDWEYPNFQGIGCNTINPNDTANFLAFLQEFRKAITGKKITVSASVPLLPFRNATGLPSTDVSEFADVFDYINIMAYDINGPWSPRVGPNAPLADSCTESAYQFGSVVTAVKAWRTAGFPLKKMVLGVPAYGHSYRVPPADAFKNNTKQLAPNPPFNSSQAPLGDSWDNTTSIDACGVKQPSGGTWSFRGLVAGGWLDQDGNPAQGIYSRYDNCSRTPYLYNEQTQVMISYDDAQSYAAKGKFIADAGLRGFAMWEAGGDYNDILLSSIKDASGIN
ncbi:hypothetical protein ID866_6576, partial [Astraeus odoratus]